MTTADASPYFQAAVATFHPLQEDVVACEKVLTVSGKRKERKERILVLCVPSEGARTSLTEGGVVYVADMERRALRPKVTLRVSRLESIEHAGMFDATFVFSGATVAGTFESHLQRELFVGAVKRIQRDVQRGGAGGATARADVVGFVSQSMEDAANAAAAAKVKSLRQARRRAFGPEEEARLLAMVKERRAVLADVSQLEGSLARQAKRAELEAAREIVDASAAWSGAQKCIASLNDAVRAVQSRIGVYADSLLSKKTILRKIEQESSQLHRKLENVQALSLSMHELEERLNLSSGTLSLLNQLSREHDELVRFFTNRDRSRTVATAMKHMERMLHDEALERDFPIQIVKEQKQVFLKHRKMIVAKVTLYALSVINIHRVHYLGKDVGRFSAPGRLVWRLHEELMTKLEDVGEILAALERIDMEGFAAVLRRYRASMQMVYTVEVKRFFAEARLQVKTLGWAAGQPLLGERDTADASLRHLMETDMMGATPSGAHGDSTMNYFSPSPAAAYSSTGRMGLFGSSPAVSYRSGTDPMLTEDALGKRRVSRRRGGDDSDDDRPLASDIDAKTLFIDVPELNLAKQRLQRPGQLTQVTLRAASAATAFTSRLDPTGTGCLRPDIALAIAIETVVDCVLREEAVLSKCFGLTFTPPQDEDEKEDRMEPHGSPDGGEAVSETQRQARNELLSVSLRELFAGDAILVFEGRDGQDGPTAPRGRPPLHRQGASPRRAQHRRGHDSDSDDDASSSASSDANAAELAKAKEVERRNHIKYELCEFTKYVLHRCDRVYTISALCMVRGLLQPTLPSAKSPFCRDILKALEGILQSGLAQFIGEQTESIERCGRKWLLRPHALLHCFAKMPSLLRRLEATQNSLSPELVDQTDYASAVMSFTDQSFHWLDVVSQIRQPTALEAASTVVSVADFMTAKVRDFVGLAAVRADPREIKRGYLTQYRHHAFFCAMLLAFPETAYCRELLAERYDVCIVKRERYEELYLTRLLMLDHFPNVAHFIFSAEDLARTYSTEELGHHRAVCVDAVRAVLDVLEGEMTRGVPSAAARMRKHFTRDVRPNTPEETFHLTLLHVTWAHFVDLLVAKLVALEGMVRAWPHLRNATPGLVVPFRSTDLRTLLDATVVGKSKGGRDYD